MSTCLRGGLEGYGCVRRSPRYRSIHLPSLFFPAGTNNRTHTQLTKYATDFIPCAISNVERSSEGLLKPDSCGALKTFANWFQRTATSSKKAVQVEKYLKNDKTATHSARLMILVLICRDECGRSEAIPPTLQPETAFPNLSKHKQQRLLIGWLICGVYVTWRSKLCQ